ncbi:hypothetical protein DPEC_G00202170 [Dallia pectoralis]|uniref:Uncharacterized protein n=1 Tax=Dallia pectoralis TaxID=75939 RepID=A0ACC2G9F7_DALPE|nr:hypothetical protein DPEC_G00202170 [Dallia pectoralis]
MPLLPNLDLKNDPSELTELVQTYKQEVTEAACELICDWAQKILKRSFDTVVEIARFLVQEHIVNPRCSQAELVTSAAMAGGPARPPKVIKKNPVPSKGSESEGISAESKRDKDGDQSSPGKPQSSDKPTKGAESVRQGGRDLQVEALMKNLPRILPRSSVPDKSQLTVSSSPPSLAPKDTGGVKVITMTTVPHQQGGALPVMILPHSLSYADQEKAPQVTMAPVAQTSVVQRARAVSKRLPELPGATSGAPGPAGTPAKRKRGRPRKPRPEDNAVPQQPPLPSVSQVPIIQSHTGGVIQKACSSSQVVEVLFQDQQALVLGQLHQVADIGDPEQRGVVLETDPRPVLLLPGAGHTNWDTTRALVEVIQRTPTVGTKNNNNISQSHPQHCLTTPLDDQSEVELTLTPIQLSDCQSIPTYQVCSEGCPAPDDSSAAERH